MKIYCAREQQSDAAIYDKLKGTNLWVKVKCKSSEFGMLRGEAWVQIVEKFPKPAADGSPMYLAHWVNDSFVNKDTGVIDDIYSKDFLKERKRDITFLSPFFVTILRPITYLTTEELFGQE